MQPDDKIKFVPFAGSLESTAAGDEVLPRARPLKCIRVLLVEDSPGDARLIQEYLAEVEGLRLEVEGAARLTQGMTRLAGGGIDVVLLDLSLPDSRGMDT